MSGRQRFCTFQGQHLSKSDKKNQHSLREAIQSRNINLVKDLVENGTLTTNSLRTTVSRFSSELSYPTPLHLAVASRSTEIVKILLNAGANINLKDRTGETSLTLAAKIGSNSLSDLLLSYNVQNVESTHDGLSHLHVACMRNKVNVVQKLLLMGAIENINDVVKTDSPCWAGYTPLHCAVQYGCIETVKLLVSCGANITAKNASLMTPLHLADFQRDNIIVDLLLSEHMYEFKNPANKHGLTHFHIACTRDNPLIVEHFLKSGVNIDLEVNSSPWEEWRPIHFAIYHGCLKVVELLLERETYLDETLYNLLKGLLQTGNEAIYDLFCQRKTRSVNIKSYAKLTEIQCACIENSAEDVESLLSNYDRSTPCTLNTSMWMGWTLAHLAARYSYTSTIESLLNHGVDFMVQDARGRTPFHIAFEKNRISVMDKVIENMDSHSSNLTDNTGLSIFHILCTTNQEVMVRKFLSQGVDVNAQVSDDSALWAGFTAMHFATQSLENKIVVLLLENGANAFIKNVMNLSPYDLLTDNFDCYINFFFNGERFSEILIAILASSSGESNMNAISPLHALCLRWTSDVEMLQHYLTPFKDEINKISNLPNSYKFDKCTALHFAMQLGIFGKASLLLKNGADPSITNGNGETPLECAAHLVNGRSFQGTECIFSLQTPIEMYKPSHFHLACLSGCTNIVTHLLNKTTDQNSKRKLINSRNDDGETPLHSVISRTADKSSIDQITHVLLENGSDVDARNLRFETPLHLAEYEENLEIMRTLISYGADVNAQDLLFEETPLYGLFHSFEGNNKKRLILLLESGADINIPDYRGRSCLMERFEERLNEDDSSDARNDSIDCYVTLLEHVAKLRVIGFYISSANEEAYAKLLNSYSEFFDEADFIRKCEIELESMMSVKIDSRTTLHDILFKNYNQMVSYSNNVVLQTMYDSQEFFEKFPIYRYLIRLQLKRGKTRGPLLMKSEKFFLILSKKSLPSSCLEAIFQYLSNADLRNMCLTSGQRDNQEILQ